MLETENILKIGQIAQQALLYPMLPQKLTEAELGALAGGQFGFDILAGHLYPDMARIIERFGGGRFDAALKAKIQTWLNGWVEPPEHYVVHHPFFASGQWWRVFRTSMFMEKDLEEAHEAARVLSQKELEARYGWMLGLDAHERFTSHREWWETVLATIRMGSWHLSMYSPRYQAFISPFVLDAEETGGEVLMDLQSEWPKPSFRLFPVEGEAGFGVFDFARMIYSGAYIEVFGDLEPAPPFGKPWGKGVTTHRAGEDQIIAGVIQVWVDSSGQGHRRINRVSDEPDITGVSIDGPDPFRMVQSIFSVTGWLPKGVASELMAPDRLNDLVESCQFLQGPTGDTPLLVPKEVFLDAVQLNPALVPVFGKIVSLSVE